MVEDEGGQPADDAENDAVENADVENADVENDVVVAEVVAVRRAPRYRAFVGVGALAFAGVAALSTVVSDGLPGLVVVLLAGGAAVVGGLLGALVAVLADRSAAR